jgi:putative transposase
MSRFRSVRYRLYPTRKQANLMGSALEGCRFVYNKEVEMCRKAYETCGRIFNRKDIDEYCEYVLKLDHPRLNEIHPDCISEVSNRVAQAFRKFESEMAGGLSPELPAFRGPDRYASFSFIKYGGNICLIGNRLRIISIGDVKCVAHRSFEGHPISCTISRSSTGKWFATISCVQQSIPCKPSADKGPVGIDLGLYNLAAFSDGTVYDNTKLFDRMASEMVKIQRKMSECDTDSDEFRKYKRRLCHLFEHYNNKMRDEMHKRSTEIVESYSMIALEDISVKELIHSYHTSTGRRNQYSSAWRMLVEMIEYKAVDSGVQVIFVDPRNTSQICSRCGHYVRKDLGVRVHSCPACGFCVDRDINAAMNILNRGLGMQASFSGKGNSQFS